MEEESYKARIFHLTDENGDAGKCLDSKSIAKVESTGLGFSQPTCEGNRVGFICRSRKGTQNLEQRGEDECAHGR